MAARIAHNVWIDPTAEIGEDVSIGPFCSIGPRVKIGRGTRLEANVTLMSHVTLGENNHVFPGAVVGGWPQDLSFSGADTWVRIGDGNIIREGVTIHRASEKENMVTEIGSSCFLMAYAHVGHDCYLGDNVVMANNVMLGGHAHIHNNVTIAGGAAVHQFGSIGEFSFVGGNSAVRLDIPPFMLAEGNPARPRCANLVGLRRNGFSEATILQIGRARKLIYRDKVALENARKQMEDSGPLAPEVSQYFDFIEFSRNGVNGRGREALRRKAA